MTSITEETGAAQDLDRLAALAGLPGSLAVADERTKHDDPVDYVSSGNMSEASATVRPGQCAEKRALIGQIKEVIAEILRVHGAELEVVVNGDFTQKESTAGRLKELLGHKILPMDRIQNHVSTHGC